MSSHSFNIEMQHLSVGYELPGGEQLKILNNIHFSATQGEMVALIGSNGIGKSTLLRTLAGFQPWFSGDIQISGRSLKDVTAKELATIMSFVSTENVRIPNLSVFDLKKILPM